MTRVSDTQAIVLSAAAQRLDGNVLPLPGSLRGGAAGKVASALLARGLICEQTSDSHARADAALNTIWRNDEGGRAIVLRITAAGLEAIGVEPPNDLAHGTAGEAKTEAANETVADPASAAEHSPAQADPNAPTEAAHGKASQRRGAGRTDSGASSESSPAAEAEGPSATRTTPLRGKAREGTKQALLIAMLRRAEGATIAQVVEATGWQPHTVRGALAGALKKRLGLDMASEKLADRGRVYRITS